MVLITARRRQTKLTLFVKSHLWALIRSCLMTWMGFVPTTFRVRFRILFIFQENRQSRISQIRQIANYETRNIISNITVLNSTSNIFLLFLPLQYFILNGLFTTKFMPHKLYCKYKISPFHWERCMNFELILLKHFDHCIFLYKFMFPATFGHLHSRSFSLFQVRWHSVHIELCTDWIDFIYLSVNSFSFSSYFCAPL